MGQNDSYDAAFEGRRRAVGSISFRKEERYSLSPNEIQSSKEFMSPRFKTLSINFSAQKPMISDSSTASIAVGM